MEPHASTSTAADETIPQNNLDSKREDALIKRQYVVRELVDTERDYVKHLSIIVNGFKAMMNDPEAFNFKTHMPAGLLRNGKNKIVFGNVDLIYKWHRDVFLPAIEGCVVKPYLFGELFDKHKSTFDMHITYCSNKLLSETVVSAYHKYFEKIRKELGHKLQLGDFLIKPVQRIMKYEMLMKEMCKYTARAGLTDEAKMLKQGEDAMREVAKVANEIMEIYRVNGFNESRRAQGDLLFRARFTCVVKRDSDSNHERRPSLHVFLFEKCIIISEKADRNSGFVSVPGYVYKTHIQANKIIVKKRPRLYPDDPTDETIIISSTESLKQHFIFHIPDPELRSELWQKLQQMQDIPPEHIHTE